ncbi:MAG TPA: hypothetical protein VFP84_20725 [Kofleriaceae bacterium]|nr:hypothetical protein [Kofleriaceae bacterium]
MTRRGTALTRFTAAALTTSLAVALTLALTLAIAGTRRARADVQRTIAGSLQLDYLAVPTDSHAARTTFDGMTAEASLKMSIDFTRNASASVKICFACHGFEAAAAFVDLRAADELAVRIGRLTPEFGSFPQRGDPANHRSSDKPLPYDMGRMLHHNEWNEGVLPAPWVDNGAELLGTWFVDGGRVDYAAYILSGPKGTTDGDDFNFVSSRDPQKYYVDNNSEPTFGARLSGGLDLDSEGHSLTLGGSAMTGHYDADRKLGFYIVGADLVANLEGVTLRGEYLVRRTGVDVGDMPITKWRFGPGADGKYDSQVYKHGFYAEAEVPLGERVDTFARFDGMLRYGNVLKSGIDSALSSRARVFRYTLGAAFRVSANIRLKTSLEYYQFSDFDNDLAIHVGVATPF